MSLARVVHRAGTLFFVFRIIFFCFVLFFVCFKFWVSNQFTTFICRNSGSWWCGESLFFLFISIFFFFLYFGMFSVFYFLFPKCSLAMVEYLLFRLIVQKTSCVSLYERSLSLVLFSSLLVYSPLIYSFFYCSFKCATCFIFS